MTDAADIIPAWIPREEFEQTAPVRGRKARLAWAADGCTVGNVAGTEITLLSSHKPSDLGMLRYVCALNGWRIVSAEPEGSGSRVVVNVDRTGAQVVDIDPVHGTGFAPGWYYGGPGAWGGYGVRNAAGPWYRFDSDLGLRPVPAAEATAWLLARAERVCRMDADMVGSVEIG